MKNIHNGLTEKILRERSVIGLGNWEKGKEMIDQFRDEMKKGDIVAIKEGETPIALVKVISDSYDEEHINDELDWFPIRRTVKILDFYKPDYSFIIPSPRKTLSICRDLKKETSKNIIKWYNKIMEKNSKKNIKDLLLHKKQIIMQGPPGTGKTYTAKLIAEELTKNIKELNSLEYIRKYIQEYKTNKDNLKKKSEIDALLKEFQETFPKDKLNDKLNLESYCIGTGSENTFCNWIENNLEELGKFSPGKGGSPVYKVYYSKGENKYKSENGDDPYKAMIKISEIIYNLVKSENTEHAREFSFRKGFILKILNSYYPEKYFPVYNQEHIKNIAKLFKLEVKSLDEIEINKKINEEFNKLRSSYSSLISNYEMMSALYDKFYDFIKTGESSEVEKKVEFLGDYKLIQFHPSYSYEDFVRGISATVNKENQIEYKVENRIVLDFALKALIDQNNYYVLIIDEINRANLSSVLGEMIYALEYRYDEKNPKETTVESMYVLKKNKEDIGNNELKLPKNLLIIGTMNTADRSVGHIDYAIRRRFAFYEMLPSASVIEEVVKDKDLSIKATNLFKSVAELFNSEHLSSDFKANQVQLGHSYFLAEDEKDLQLKLEYEIKPILEEYLRDGILLEGAGEIIKNLKL